MEKRIRKCSCSEAIVSACIRQEPSADCDTFYSLVSSGRKPCRLHAHREMALNVRMVSCLILVGAPGKAY